MSNNSSYLETVHFDNASEFLDYLQPRNPRWLPSNSISIPWIFRGQRKAEWKLRPSAMRNKDDDERSFRWLMRFKNRERDVLLEIVNNLNITYRHDEFRPSKDLLCEMILQAAAESYAVNEFVALADEVGHSIPDDQLFRLHGDFSLPEFAYAIATNYSATYEKTGKYGGERLYEFTAPEFIEFALAQHHGIPTRLLDWTRSPFVAAFFAAEEIVYSSDKADYDMAVWALDTAAIEVAGLRLKSHRRAKISYLHAQEGVFIYDSLANLRFLMKGIWPSFEQVIYEHYFEIETAPILRKISLASKHAIELLRMLSVERVTRAHIMPTYDNVTKTLETKPYTDNS